MRPDDYYEDLYNKDRRPPAPWLLFCTVLALVLLALWADL